MNKLTLFIFGITTFCCISAQQLELMSAAGASGESSNALLSWSVGECVSETFSQSSVKLTQGLLQANLGVVAFSNQLTSDLKISLYPNPSITHVILEASEFSGLTYELYSVSGSILDRKEVVSDKTQISFERLPAATYYIKVIDGVSSYMTYKIVKQ